MTDARLVREQFAVIAGLPDEEIDLGRAALLIAQEEYPEISIERWLGRLDGLAMAAQRRAAERSTAYEVVAALNEYLFFDLNFRGNEEDYYDPRNSFLNVVLDRRIGIPITLAAVYIEVGRRLGMSLAGVGFPGHFLVRYRTAGTDILIDPFHRGKVMLPEDLASRLHQIYGSPVPIQPHFLATVSTRQILMRMLNNLKQIYLHHQDYQRARVAVERMLILYPEDALQRRDLGLINLQLGDVTTGCALLEEYLERAPDAEDAPLIREQIARIRQQGQ